MDYTVERCLNILCERISQLAWASVEIRNPFRRKRYHSFCKLLKHSFRSYSAAQLVLQITVGPNFLIANKNQ
jgi:hypothetical protein